MSSMPPGERPTDPVPPARSLGTGVHVQSYIDAIHGATHVDRMDAYKRACDELHAAGATSIFPHLFPHGLSAFGELSGAALAAGMSFGGALGLDSSSISPEDKGDAIAEVGTRPGSLGCLSDSESHFDPRRRDEMRRMGSRARQRAPGALIIAQPWPEPLVHPGFPYEEEDAFCDEEAPQWYINDWSRLLGRGRYAHLLPIFRSQQETLITTRLAPRGLTRPYFPTWQGYGWDDIPADCGDAIITYRRFVIWCEPFPKTLVLRQIRARAFLVARGFIAADWSDASTAVIRFQREYNRTASTKIQEDGRNGLVTLGMMGI